MKFLLGLTQFPNSPQHYGYRRQRSGRTFERLEDRLMLTSVVLGSPSTNGGDGAWIPEERAGTSVHVGSNYLYYNIDMSAVFPDFQPGQTLYVKVNYYDEGVGYLRVQYDSLDDNFVRSNFHARSSAADTRQFVSSYHVLEHAEFANGTNGNDFRVATGGLPISTVEVSSQLFPHSGLEWSIALPWESPYTGPSRDDVSTATLNGKIMTGYQGWFNTPNDKEDSNYRHWGSPGNWNVDQWPDPNDYDAAELFAVPGVTTASGDQAYLFSSDTAEVVRRHFQWMRQYDIDGAFIQRFSPTFMSKGDDGNFSGPPQWPLVNIREAAHREGRTWAIEYDIQNAGDLAARDEMIQKVKDDWEFLIDPEGFNLLGDARYQHEGGKPVVAIFGLYLNASNSYSTTQQVDLINYFQSQGVYVIGAGRHSQTQSQIANAGLHDAYIPWQGYWAGGNSYLPAGAALSGVTEHIPHVFPGFSWTHLQNDSTASSRDRENGNFYWRMLRDAVNQTEAPWLFIGMFDEYDEATNLIPASDDPPIPDTDSGGSSLVFQTSHPMPNDWWMALTGAAKQALLGKSGISSTMPTPDELANRSNVGEEARWQPLASDRLAIVETTDSQIETAEVTVYGHTSHASYSLGPYLYFQVADSFLADELNGRDVTVEVEYLDSTAGSFRLAYDGIGHSYQTTSLVQLTGSGEWRTHRFEIPDATFAKGQNGASDFRIEKPGGNLLVRHVRVVSESHLSVTSQLGFINVSRGLTQVDLPDGQTVHISAGGRNARVVTGTLSSRYMYFRVDDQFAHEVSAGLNAIVEVVYYDSGSGTLNIQYDSTDSNYKSAQPHSLTNSGIWRTARFAVSDAFFGNSQNENTDFRLVGNNIAINQVRVLRPLGDLIPPAINSVSATVDLRQSLVTMSWELTDDWATGLMDQWSEHQTGRVQIDWSSDNGATWHTVDQVFQRLSPTAISSYDTSSGHAVWSDQYVWHTSQLPEGTYQLRVTPKDAQGNLGAPFTTTEFALISPPVLPGDYNLDGIVDLADFTLWRNTLGTTVSPFLGADGDGDGKITVIDYQVWKSHFGQSLSPSTALADSAVPNAQSPDESPLLATLAGQTGPSSRSAAGPSSQQHVASGVLRAHDPSASVSPPNFGPTSLMPAPRLTELSDEEWLLLLASDAATVRPPIYQDGTKSLDRFFADEEALADLTVLSIEAPWLILEGSIDSIWG